MKKPPEFKFLEVIFGSHRSYDKQIDLTSSIYVEEVDYMFFYLIRSYIAKLYLEHAESERLKVQFVFSLIDKTVSKLKITGYDEVNNLIINNSDILPAIILFNEELHFVSSLIDDISDKCFISVDGKYPKELVKILTEEAIKNSGYAKKILRIELVDDKKIVFKVVPNPSISINDIYTKNKDEIIDFMESVGTKNSLRYMLVGEPGTGKTDTVRAIISECKDKYPELTILLADKGCKVPLNTIIKYAEIFKPVIICIDDIDLIANRREYQFNNEELSTALQVLDGFVDIENIAFIATTNERELVDRALRRPGRFDLILEFGPLPEENYADLVYRETKDEKLKKAFEDERVFNRLKHLKPTGAFLVTLVKHLMNPRYEKEKYNPDTILKIIDRLYKSFKLELKKEAELGF